MQTFVASELPVALSEGQRAALISLLADDDPAVYQLVRSKLLAFGPAAVEWLRPYALSPEPKLRRRVLAFIADEERRLNGKRFVDYCRRKGEELDLEEATCLLASTRFPEIRHEGYAALYDSWANELSERVASENSSTRTLEKLNRFIFEELGFQGDEQYAYEPESCYINRIVDRRRGNPIGLCSIYLFLTRRLRLPVTGIGLPGHFICRYQDSKAELYIDCFRKGLFLTKADCIKYLLRANYGIADGHLSPVTPKKILLRMCNNLVSTYGHLEMAEEAAKAKGFVKALTR
jgi:regulator of sirC expression with transglutaminase-like and TPR domain